MIAIRCIDNKPFEIEKSPAWLKRIYPESEFYFNSGGFYYSLQSEKPNYNVRYLVQNKIYYSNGIGTEKQIEILKETHKKTDGYVQLSIFDV